MTSRSELVQSISGSICGPEWFYTKAMEEYEQRYESGGYILTPETEDLE
jgi:hypothetical protein